MRRPRLAREALRRGPLAQARRANSTGIKRVPFIPTGARPAVVLAGRPAAERASNARAGRIEALLLIRLAIQDRRVIREDAHDPICPILCPSSDEWAAFDPGPGA
jgi:hypothetical protein